MQFSIHPTNTKEWRSCCTIIRLKHFHTKTTLSAYSPGGGRSKVNGCGLFLYLNSLNYKSQYACIRAHYLILMAVWIISMGLQCFANVSLFDFSCVCVCVCYFSPFKFQINVAYCLNVNVRLHGIINVVELYFQMENSSSEFL